MKVQCCGCLMYREVKETGELILTYEKRRPLCKKCGNIKRIETLGGHGPTWRGGVRYVGNKGYVIIWDDIKKIYVREHRKIWEENFGSILKGYVIHHKDGDRQNNAIENLECLFKLNHDKMNKSLLFNHYNKGTKRTEVLCVV